MIRKEREIRDKEELLSVLERCDTLSIGMQGEVCPYVVPVSFGIVRSEAQLYIYFHGARRGYKVERMEKNPMVCVEGHLFHGVEETQHGITARYESIIGFGAVRRVEGDEAVSGLRSITEHYHRPAYPVDKCKGLPVTAVYRIKIEQLTGKRNLPE